MVGLDCELQICVCTIFIQRPDIIGNNGCVVIKIFFIKVGSIYNKDISDAKKNKQEDTWYIQITVTTTTRYRWHSYESFFVRFTANRIARHSIEEETKRKLYCLFRKDNVP